MSYCVQYFGFKRKESKIEIILTLRGRLYENHQNNIDTTSSYLFGRL